MAANGLGNFANLAKRLLIWIAAAAVAVGVIALLAIEVLEAAERSTGEIGDGGIDSLEYVELGGVEQAIYVRGHDPSKPVMLFLHGGPGSPTTPFARRTGTELEKSFVVVHWDQRGAGNSCTSAVPNESLNLEQYLADTLELIQYLRTRFDEERIVLVGHSWGSILGVMTAQRHPQLLDAYVGMGQVVNLKRNEEVSYAYVVSRAKTEKNEEALEELGKIAPPYALREDLLAQRKWLSYYQGDVHSGNGMQIFAQAVIASPEYDLSAKLSFLSCVWNSIDQAWDEVESVDFLSTALSLEVPVFFFAGRHDYNTPFELVEEYFEALSAPHKEMVWFENSAHSPNVEEPDRYQELMFEKLSHVLNDR
jgi:pimeloyl-ACP methyl ester carboxylesterase